MLSLPKRIAMVALVLFWWTVSYPLDRVCGIRNGVTVRDLWDGLLWAVSGDVG